MKTKSYLCRGALLPSIILLDANRSLQTLRPHPIQRSLGQQWHKKPGTYGFALFLHGHGSEADGGDLEAAVR